MNYQYGVKLIKDKGIVMSLPTDDQGFEELTADLRAGDGYGTDYVIVRREVGNWEDVD